MRVVSRLSTGVSGGSVRFRGRVLPVLGTYGDAEAGQALALLGSEGELELAVRDGSAAEALGAGRGDAVTWLPA